MTYSEIQQVQSLERRIAKWDEEIETLITKRDRAQGRLDELLSKNTMDEARILRTISEYKRRIETLNMEMEKRKEE